MRKAFLLVIPLLMGCDNRSNLESTLAKCQLEALKEYKTPILRDMQVVNYVTLCMRSVGYDYQISRAGCSVDLDNSRPSCYRPMNWIDGKIDDAEIWWDQ
jgi:hypothetical protein